VKRTIRDIVVAVIGAAVVSLVLGVSTPLTPLELLGATLGACVLVLGGLHLTDMIRHWIRRRSKARNAVLAELFVEGRMLQARLGEAHSANVYVPNELAINIARWEAQAINALVDQPAHLNHLKEAPGKSSIDETTGDAFRRMQHQLNVIENAMRFPQRTR
jgi:hypothetical protein